MAQKGSGRKPACGHTKHYAHGKCKSCYERAWRTSEYDRNINLKSKYGITRQEFDARLMAQGNVCAICKQAGARTGRAVSMHVDHSHASGAIRGILCGPCNRALGYMEDSPARLLAAAAYLGALPDAV